MRPKITKEVWDAFIENHEPLRQYFLEEELLMDFEEAKNQGHFKQLILLIHSTTEPGVLVIKTVDQINHFLVYDGSGQRCPDFHLKANFDHLGTSCVHQLHLRVYNLDYFL